MSEAQEQIRTLAERNVGAQCTFLSQYRGSSTWSRTTGIIHPGFKIFTNTDEYCDFPHADFIYKGIEIAAADGRQTRLEPSPEPAPPRDSQERRERREIFEKVIESHNASSMERGAMRALLEQIDGKAEAQRANIHETLQQMGETVKRMGEAVLQMRAEGESQRSVLLNEIRSALIAQQPHQQPPQPFQQQQATARTQQTTTDTATIGRRQELDVFFPSEWDLSSPEKVNLKRLQITQYFEINARSSPYRLRAFNALSLWMDQVLEQQLLLATDVMPETTVEMGKVLLENLRAVVAQEDKR